MLTVTLYNKPNTDFTPAPSFHTTDCRITSPFPAHQTLPSENALPSRKMEIPSFMGPIPSAGWLGPSNISPFTTPGDDLKVTTAFICIELPWLRWLQQYPTRTMELLEEFVGELSGLSIEQIAPLHQIRVSGRLL